MVFYIRTKAGDNIMEIEAFLGDNEEGITKVSISTSVDIVKYSVLLLGLKSNRDKSVLTMLVNDLDNTKGWYYCKHKGGGSAKINATDEDVEAIHNHIKEVMKVLDRAEKLELVLVED